MENKNYIWRPVSEYTGGRVLATNGLDVLIGEINSDGDCESEEGGSTILCGITGFIKIEEMFPELKESEKRMIQYFKDLAPFDKADELYEKYGFSHKAAIAWLEKQGNEPNWCHHKVDLSNCSEEYRKAYYDGWNNCNMQHSQCKSESNDVVKCLINGMKFYYEDNEEATWGTDKWSMPVKHIIEVLEKQCEQKSYASETMNEKGDFDNGFTRMMEKEQKPTDEELKKLLRAEYEKGRAKGKAQTLCEMPKEIDSQVWQIANNAAITWEQSFAILMAAKNAYDKGKADAIVQTPSWSEEDERLCQCLIEGQEEALDKVSNDKYGHSEIISDLKEMYRERIDWLKSLKDRVQPQSKQEWSEEDKHYLRHALLSTYAVDVATRIINKALRPQSHWKPSDEQMKALDSAIHCYAGISPTNNREVFALEIMKEQLKKLRGE